MQRRILQKKVNGICSELFAECIALAHYNLVNNREDADNVMFNILAMHEDFVSRISHVEPGSVKLFFSKFHDDLRARVDEITTQLQNLL